jgi:hypothetical protein
MKGATIAPKKPQPKYKSKAVKVAEKRSEAAKKAAEQRKKDAFFKSIGYEKMSDGGYGTFEGMGKKAQPVPLPVEEVERLWQGHLQKRSIWARLVGTGDQETAKANPLNLKNVPKETDA